MTFVMDLGAQTTIDSVLVRVEQNNKKLQANKQYWEAKKMEYQTGLTLEDPVIEFDYLFGSQDGVSNQSEVVVIQSFDFPSVYKKKRELANEQIKQTDFQLRSLRQAVLFEVQTICIELVYRQKLRHNLDRQKSQTEKLLDDFNMKLDNGEGNILDVNKAQLQLLNVKNAYAENMAQMDRLNTKLIEHNGGVEISFSDTVYSSQADLPTFNTIEQETEKNDPLRKYYEVEKNIVQKELEVSRLMRLPKFEAGYRYNGGSGESLNGFHTGVSIPLWANKNKVQHQEARLVFSDIQMQDHVNDRYYEIKKLYDQYENLKDLLYTYNETLDLLNNESLLNKALTLGHISTIEYFMETSYFNNALNNYIKIEMDYQMVIAELLKYKL